MDSKAGLRQKYTEIRRNIALPYRNQAMQLAAHHFLQFPLLGHNKAIACYLPREEEFDTTAIINTIWQKNCTCYLPVITVDQQLQFFPYQEGDAVQANRFAILEPVKREQPIAPKDLDIVITPLLAFDQAGHRLGTGGGYYDKTFAFLHDNYYRKPFFLGLGYAQQWAEEVPADPWDINLDGVLTEEALLRIFI